MRYVQFIYNKLFHKERLMKKVSYGETNKEKTIFVVRPNSEDCVQGLMSLFIQSMRWIDYATQKGYEPYVDFLNYKTQYYEEENNVWDYFFSQKLKYDDVKNSKNVILSGCSLKKTVNLELFRDRIMKDDVFAKYCHNLIWNNIELSEEVKNILYKEAECLNITSCLGVYVRGTDYVKLQPIGEYIQPSIEDVIEKIDEFLEKYKNTNIFLVTEDGSYYEILKKEFGKKIVLVSYDNFICNYDGKDFLSKSNVLDMDKKRRGMEYLIKILLLSKCKYLISSITYGSLAAYSFNGGKYIDKYIFDLGFYK